MLLPKSVIVGEDIIRQLDEVISEVCDCKGYLLISGPNVYRKLKRRLDRTFLSRVREVFLVMDATKRTVEGIAKQMRVEEGVAIVGLGGGKSIDVAKTLAYEKRADFISVPTSASHDGISSPLASIKDDERKVPYSVMTKPPLQVIVDVDVVAGAPHRLIASGVGDALAKLTAVMDWKLASERIGEYYGEYAAALARMGAELVLRIAEGIGKGDKESIRTLVEALISDGVAAGIAGSSRPCSGSEHLFSHALDMYSTQHALHGEQCGVGTIIMSYLHELDSEVIRESLEKAKAPVDEKTLGISRENLVRALLLAKKVRPDRYTICLLYTSPSPRDLSTSRMPSSA